MKKRSGTVAFMVMPQPVTTANFLNLKVCYKHCKILQDPGIRLQSHRFCYFCNFPPTLFFQIINCVDIKHKMSKLRYTLNKEPICGIFVLDG